VEYPRLQGSKERNVRILVTGGAGFLGSHLCEKLIELNHEVIAVDNLYTGEKSKLAKIIHHPNFELVRQDVTSPLNFEVDGIMNLACPASPVHYQKFPVQTIKTSVLGAINVLDLANRLKVPVFQASTSEVYGDPSISPQNESYWGNVNPIGIRACYDEGKRSAETLFFDFHRQYQTQIKVARIFNTYGPRMSFNDGRVVSNFIVQALKNQPITIYGDGNQTRSFCYVSDLIDGFIKLMFSKPEVTGPINLGNPKEFTMLELAQEVIRQTNSESKVSFQELPQDDPKQRKPDIEKAQKLLEWEPSVELVHGLEMTIEEFKTRL
jgi:UDP-glucuronate decarboxylase